MEAVAVFSDVEGTLIDASLPRLSITLGRELRIFTRGQLVRMALMAALGRLLPNQLRQKMQVAIMIQAMAGHTSAEADRLAVALVPRALARAKPTVLQRLAQYRQAAIPIVLVSGGLQPAITHLAAELGMQGTGTRLQMHGDRYIARLDGPLCQGIGKAERVRQLAAEAGYDLTRCIGFGDTANDIPFLELCGESYAVDPDPELAAEAQRRGWPIILTTEPVAVEA